jgi:hypothetical protein
MINKKMAEMGSTFIRDRLRETSFARRVMPAAQVSVVQVITETEKDLELKALAEEFKKIREAEDSDVQSG